MAELQILGLLVNSNEYNSYLHNENTGLSYVAKLAIWYLISIFGFICSIYSLFM